MSANKREFRVHLIGGDDDETATISLTRHGDVCHLSLRYRDQELHSEGSDFFKAFCDLRNVLEEAKLIPFCYGASLNVHPSGMCRDMGQGMVAYRLTNGVKPSQKDVVRIFDEGPDVIPASVTLQREFFYDWLASIGVNGPSKQ